MFCLEKCQNIIFDYYNDYFCEQSKKFLKIEIIKNLQ